MKKALEKYFALIMVFAVVTAVCALFSYRKSGMFIDEVYSYGLANSHYAPFVTSIKGGDMTDTIFTRDEVLDYLCADEDDSFDFGSVYYNQEQDVHPPLYYWLMNIASSLGGGGFSKWTGLALNYIAYITALFFLYKLVMTLFGSVDNAAAAVIIYGLSIVGTSTMMMVRMYALLTMFTVLLAYLVALLMKKRRGWLYPLIFLTVLAGLMTQYYYVFFAFFLCTAYDIYALVKRDYKSFFIFSLCAVAGVAALVLLFPACLNQLFANALVSGRSAVDNLLSFSQYSDRLDKFLKVKEGLKALRYVFCAALALLLLSCVKVFKAAKEKRVSPDALVILIPALVCFVVVAVVSPVSELRYIYNIIPIIVLGLSFVFYLIETGLGNFKHVYAAKKLALLLVVVVAIMQAKASPPAYLYPEHTKYNALVDAHNQAPCVYFDANYPAPVTQDLLQLMRFDTFFVTDDPASTKMLDYIGDAKEVVVYVDTSEFWSSGYDAEDILQRFCDATGFTQRELLYSYELSETYILT